MMEKINIVLGSSRKEIKKIEDRLEHINQKLQIKREKFINLQIAVSEALVNAIVHGNKENINKKVYVWIQYDSGFIEISIKDEGEGFDIDSLPDPTAEENIMKESGRGIFIIRSLVDYFECSSSSSGTFMKLVVKK